MSLADQNMLDVNTNAPRPVLAPAKTAHELEVMGEPVVKDSAKGNPKYPRFIRVALRFRNAGPTGEEYLNFWDTLHLKPISWEAYKTDYAGNEYTDDEAKAFFIKVCNRRDNLITDFMTAAGIPHDTGLATENGTNNDGENVVTLPAWKGARLQAIVGISEASDDFPASNTIGRVVL